MRQALFELSLLGGRVEKRWRRQRPDIERMPWASLDPDRLTPELVNDARKFWTRAAFAEHRAAAATAAVQRALVEARAPIDLIAAGGNFVLDELAHVELCARVANQLGGGASLSYDVDKLVPPIDEQQSPLGRAAQLVLAVNCVSETFLLEMQRFNKRELRQPLVRSVLASITRDEAAHARFGWLFFEWAEPLLEAGEREVLKRLAAHAIAMHLPSGAAADEARETLGWMPDAKFRRLAAQVMEQAVAEPLRARNLL